jgi:predicted transcriptional regulator
VASLRARTELARVHVLDHALAQRADGIRAHSEVAAKLGVSETAVHEWGHQGLIKKCYTDSMNRGLWEIPSGQTILKGCGGRGARPARLISIAAQSPE